MKKTNKFLNIAMLILASILLSKNVFEVNLPHYVVGLGYGAYITFMVLGVYSTRNDVSKLRSYKAAFFRRCLGR